MYYDVPYTPTNMHKQCLAKEIWLIGADRSNQTIDITDTGAIAWLARCQWENNIGKCITLIHNNQCCYHDNIRINNTVHTSLNIMTLYDCNLIKRFSGETTRCVASTNRKLYRGHLSALRPAYSKHTHRVLFCMPYNFVCIIKSMFKTHTRGR